MFKTAALAMTLALSMGVAHADDKQNASAEETAKVNEAIAKIGCKADEIEKESATLFEIDDAVCETGQYDIKLNANYKITVMTLDE